MSEDIGLQKAIMASLQTASSSSAFRGGGSFSRSTFAPPPPRPSSFSSGNNPTITRSSPNSNIRETASVRRQQALNSSNNNTTVTNNNYRAPAAGISSSSQRTTGGASFTRNTVSNSGITSSSSTSSNNSQQPIGNNRRNTLERQGILPKGSAAPSSTTATSSTTAETTSTQNSNNTRSTTPRTSTRGNSSPKEQQQRKTNTRKQQISDTTEARRQKKQQTTTTTTRNNNNNNQQPANPLVSVIEDEIMTKNPNVEWSDVAGLVDAKRVLNEAVILPMIVPELFTGLRKPWSGVLLYGPAGTGKTMLAKAVATSAKTTFFSISASTLLSRYVGESEKLVRTLFEVARKFAPSTIFFDEIDSIMMKRGGGNEHEVSRRVKTEMLSQMDNVASSGSGADSISSRVLVLAATNCPWDIDSAMIRRLEKRIYIPLPDEESRKDLFALNLSKTSTSIDLTSVEKNKKQNDNNNNNNSCASSAVTTSSPTKKSEEKEKEEDSDEEEIIRTQLDQLVEKTCGYSGADISICLRDAAMFPLRRLISGKSPTEIYEMKQRGELSLISDGENNNNSNNNNSAITVTFEDVVEAIKKTAPTVSKSTLQKYTEWEQEFGSI